MEEINEAINKEVNRRVINLLTNNAKEFEDVFFYEVEYDLKFLLKIKSSLEKFSHLIDSMIIKTSLLLSKPFTYNAQR